jgi:hypothetical protein
MTEYPFKSPIIPANTPECERDGFPMLKINGQLECVAEYLDRCIGQQPIVDIVRHRKTAYYVFENGHELPLLCSCCDGPLDFEDIMSSRQEAVGQRLQGMSINQRVLEGGQVIEELVLEFSPEGRPLERTGMPVSFNVAIWMRHPANCPYRTRPTRPKSSSRKKKRRGKIPGRN